MKMRPLVLAVFFSSVFVNWSWAQNASSASVPAAMSLTANPVYAKNCAKCHGKTAEGRRFGGPSLISEKIAAASIDDLHGIIANGKGHMPKFAGKLASEEIDTLVMQVQALNKK
jgi:mono/diheme cytochrome c family protein